MDFPDQRLKDRRSSCDFPWLLIIKHSVWTMKHGDSGSCAWLWGVILPVIRYVKWGLPWVSILERIVFICSPSLLGDCPAVSWHCSFENMGQFTGLSGDCIPSFQGIGFQPKGEAWPDDLVFNFQTQHNHGQSDILPFLGCTSRGQSRPPDTRLGMAASRRWWGCKVFRKWQTPWGMLPSQKRVYNSKKVGEALHVWINGL